MARLSYTLSALCHTNPTWQRTWAGHHPVGARVRDQHPSESQRMGKCMVFHRLLHVSVAMPLRRRWEGYLRRTYVADWRRRLARANPMSSHTDCQFGWGPPAGVHFLVPDARFAGEMLPSLLTEFPKIYPSLHGLRGQVRCCGPHLRS